MPIEHIVLFKWKPELTPAQVARQVELMQGLRGQVPGLTDLKGGKPFRQAASDPTDADWNYALLMVFAKEADLMAWAASPHHDAFNAEFLPGVAEYLVVDFER
jgi:hypothetical protein